MRSHLRARLPILIITVFLFTLTSIGQEETTAPNVTIHVVQRGENLFRIALNYGLTTEAVAAANGITDVSNIQVGQRLIIPIDAPAETASTSETLEHIVQPGDSLGSIAEAYDLSVDFIAERNGITDPDSIYVGQVLYFDVLPVETAAVNTDTNGSSESADTTPFIHVIEQGETLFRIATNYNLTVAELQLANNISDPTMIYAGQQLIIPGVEAPRITIDLPEGVSEFNIKPLQFTEGKTGSFRMTTAKAATVTGQFLGRNLTIMSDPAGLSHTSIMPIPLFTEAGVYTLTVDLQFQDGTTANISVNIQILAGNYGTQFITLPDDKLPLLTPAVEDNEFNILQTVTSIVTPQKYFSGAMSLPAAAVMNSPYGAIRSYNGGSFDRFHSGADFAGAPGTPILAAAPGQVVLSDTLHIRGNSVVIDHGWGVYTNYSHMTERYVQIGDFVTTGQVIGTVGNTGRATGAHLHWEMWIEGIPVDPMQWVTEIFP